MTISHGQDGPIVPVEPLIPVKEENLLPGLEKPEEPIPKYRVLIEKNLLRKMKTVISMGQSDRSLDAANALQAVIDHEADYFVNLKENLSVRKFLRRWIEEQPQDVLKAYQVQYGPVASHLLKKFEATGDQSALLETARRYLHTEAGTKAAYLQACLAFDEGRFRAAAKMFERVSDLPRAPSEDQPWIAMKTAYCWVQLDRKEIARQTLGQYVASHPGRPILIDEKPYTPQQLIDLFSKQKVNQENRKATSQPIYGSHSEIELRWQKLLQTYTASPAKIQTEQPSAALPRPPTVTEQESFWPMFRKTAQRDKQHVQFNPLPLVQWDIDLIEHLLPANLPRKQAVKEILGFVLQGLESDDYTTLPAWNPIIVKQHVIVSGFGTVAAFSLTDGSLLWKSSTSDHVLEYLQSEELLTKLLGDASQNLLDYKQYLLQQLVADVTTGTLSSDGEYVFAVRECGVVNASRSQGFMQTVNELSAVPGYANRLCAFDVNSGRIHWEVGGLYGGKNQDFSGHYFLGPPVVIDKKVYLLSENGGQMVISQLDPQTGKALWMQPLTIPESEIISDRPRRLAGSSPAYCDPFLICATNSGTVVAIDLPARELSWLYTYIENPVGQNNAFTRFGRQQRRGATGPKSVDFLSGSRWQDSVPLVAGNSILLTPVDSNDLFCLDVLTGKLLWAEHRQDGMFIEVDDQENVLIVGKHKMRSLKLADGTLNWEAAMSQSPASGRGVLRGDVYQLPTVRDGLHTYDLASGSLLATTEEALSWQHPETGTATTFRAGNLTVSADQLITLRNGRLIALQPLHQVIDQIEKKLLNNPQDDQALSITGQLALHRGDLQAGLSLLQQSYRIKQSPETARQITKTLLNANTDQIVLNDKDIEELAQMMVAAEHSTEIVFRYVRALQQHHKPVEALNVLRTLLASQQKSREYVAISAERRVRADALAAGAMKEVYASANQQQQQILREESLRLFEQAPDANQLAALQPFAFDKQLSEQFRLALVRKLDEMTSPLQLERHLLWLRLNGQGNYQAEATARLARLMLHHKKTTEAAGYLAELASVYSETICLDQQTGKQLLEKWQLKYDGLNKKENDNLQGLVLNSEYDVTTIENEPPGNRYQAAPKLEVKPYHPSGSTWQYWDFHISRAIPMLVAQSPDKATQWRVSLEGKQLERIQSFSLHSQGQFALLCSDRGFIGMSGFEPQIDLKQPEVEDRHLLWDKSFSSHPGSNESQQSALLPTVAHEIIGPTPLMKSWAEEVGQLAPCYDHKLVYRLGTKIYLREADSGELLWEHQTRSSNPVLVWTDGKAVYKINNQTRSISHLRLEDGKPIGKLDHFPQHDDLLALQGSIAVLRLNLNPEQGFLIGYHLGEQRTAWRIEISATTSLTSAGNGMLALFDAGKQKLMILDPTLSSPVVCQVDAPHAQASDLFVVSDPAGWYIHFNNNPKTSIQPLVFQSKQNTNGPLIAISKLTNKIIWSSKLDQLRWLPLQPAGLPFLMYGALVIEKTIDENGEQQRNYVPKLQVIHKGTGKNITEMPEGIFGQLISADNNFQSKEFKLQFTKKTMIIKQKQP